MIGAYLLGVATAAGVALLGYALARAAVHRLEPEHNTGPLTLPARPFDPTPVDPHLGEPCVFDQDDPSGERACRCGRLDIGVVPHLSAIPRYAMLDVWVALGGRPRAFERMMSEPRRTPADTWSQLLAVVNDRGHTTFEGDTNPPPGPEFERLVTNLAAADRHDGR